MNLIKITMQSGAEHIVRSRKNAIGCTKNVIDMLCNLEKFTTCGLSDGRVIHLKLKLIESIEDYGTYEKVEDKEEQ